MNKKAINGCWMRLIAKIETIPQHNNSNAIAKITPRIFAPAKASSQIVQKVVL
jgi:hypothetical protein